MEIGISLAKPREYMSAKLGASIVTHEASDGKNASDGKRIDLSNPTVGFAIAGVSSTAVDAGSGGVRPKSSGLAAIEFDDNSSIEGTSKSELRSGVRRTRMESAAAFEPGKSWETDGGNDSRGSSEITRPPVTGNREV
jgi:hypothetical protein